MSSIKVYVSFRGICAGLVGVEEAEVELENDKFEGLISYLIKKYPKLAILFREPPKALRAYTRVLINGKEVRDKDLKTKLHNGDKISISIYGYAGG